MFESAPEISKEPNQHTSKVMDMADMFNKVRDELCDPFVMCKHIADGTTSTYLTSVINQIVLDMTIIPAARQELSLDVVDDAATVSGGFHRIANMLSKAFNESQTTIEEQMVSVMNDFPVDDVRSAYVARHRNLLH